MATIKETAEHIIALNEKFKTAYFWNPPSSASERRRYEDKNAAKVEFDFKNHHYIFDFSVDCSCRNIYVRRNYLKDGKRTTITSLKNIINEL